MLVAALLLLVALAGAADALYFVLVTYRRIEPEAPWIPRLCRMDRATCTRIIDTPWARLLGLPNAVCGLAWYAVVAAEAVARLAGTTLVPRVALGAIGGATVLVSVALAWSLLARLRVVCALCFAAHGINLIVFVLIAL